jgi:hypothetical protein
MQLPIPNLFRRSIGVRWPFREVRTTAPEVAAQSVYQHYALMGAEVVITPGTV